VALPGGWWLWRRDTLQRWQSQWLVLADWSLAQGDPGLSNVLATAFRIALQQSRFAFVMDAGAVEAALQRMRGAPPVDRAKAVEIARRESAAAAVVPGFAAFGGGILLSAEVVEAASGRTVAAAQEQLADLGQLTGALDRLAASIRRSVGEPDVDIQRDALPLAKVTTSNLDALKLFSEADLLMRARQTDQAIALLEQATVMDPDFASAYAKLGTLHAVRRTEAATAEKFWRLAAEKGSRLSRREQMYVQGCLAWIEDPTVMRARWGAMATAYPDDAPAVNNAAFVEWTQFGDLAAAERVFRVGLDIPHPWNYIIWHHLGCVELGQGRIDDSLATFAESLRRGGHPAHFGLVRALLAKHDAGAARDLLERYPNEGVVNWQLDRSEAELLLLVHEGGTERALEVADSLREHALTQRFRTSDRVGLRARMLICDARGDDAGAQAAASALHQAVAPELHSAHGGVLDLPPLELLLLGGVAARRGWKVAVDPDQVLVGRWQRFPVLQAAAELLRGWIALRDGRAQDAVRACMQGRDLAPLFAFFELEVEALAALGEAANARSRARQARTRLWQALAENHSYFSTHLGNLLAWQRLERFAG
jgi:tetratricopeptide (TPR) repeat protein